jgi:hypothetical protein
LKLKFDCVFRCMHAFTVITLFHDLGFLMNFLGLSLIALVWVYWDLIFGFCYDCFGINLWVLLWIFCVEVVGGSDEDDE